MEFIEFKGKTVDDAITEATIQFGVTSDDLIYEVIEKGSTGFLGINKKLAVIRAKKKDTLEDIVQEFLENLFKVMEVETVVDIKYKDEDKTMDINLTGPEMVVQIGKRGQTLDALQKIAQSVVNKHSEEFVRVKLDTENYRARRKDTLENLAKNIAYKVKRTKKSVVLEPMNPYERRIIHSALQNDKYVNTRSEGEEPFRRVVIYYNREK